MISRQRLGALAAGVVAVGLAGPALASPCTVEVVRDWSWTIAPESASTTVSTDIVDGDGLTPSANLDESFIVSLNHNAPAFFCEKIGDLPTSIGVLLDVLLEATFTSSNGPLGSINASANTSGLAFNGVGATGLNVGSPAENVSASSITVSDSTSDSFTLGDGDKVSVESVLNTSLSGWTGSALVTLTATPTLQGTLTGQITYLIPLPASVFLYLGVLGLGFAAHRRFGRRAEA